MPEIQEVKNSRSRQEWAAIINADWRKSIESIVQTGRDLAAAKLELPRGEWETMVKEDLPFSLTTAAALRRIGSHPVIANRDDRAGLPASWTVLRELASLKEKDFRDAQERGLITPDMGQWDATAISKAYRTPEGQPVGEGRNLRTLPPPAKARDIARETGRFVAASDGRVYSGASEEEGAEASRLTGQTYGAIDAINLLAKMPEPGQWLADAPPFQLRDLTYENAEKAANWLLDLVSAMEANG